MKTTFSRLFALFAAVIFLCLLLLGISFRVLLQEHLENEKRESLHNNAETMTNLAAAYHSTGELNAFWGDFQIAFTSAAQVAGMDALICTPEGEIFVCACQQIGCSHKDKIVDENRLEQIIQEGEVFWEGTLPGIYEEVHYIEAMTVTQQDSEEIIGILIVALLHLWKRNSLLSIGVGTVSYMLLVQFVF